MHIAWALLVWMALSILFAWGFSRFVRATRERYDDD